MRTGGQILVEQLASEGVRHVFTVPGESFLDVLDAMHGRSDIRPITTRCESGAAMMAAATGRLTGRTGIALVTRGPGAANALAGLYVASQDHAPMLLLVGLPSRSKEDWPRFQAIDVEALFGSVAKSCAVVNSADTLPIQLADALRSAEAGRPGPVVLGLPEDVLREATAQSPSRTGDTPSPAPTDRDLKRLHSFLAQASRPIVIAASASWTAAAAKALCDFAARYDLPVATAFRRQDHIDNRHASYVGHLGLAADESLRAGVRAADLVIAFGDGLDEITTDGYALLQPPRSLQQLVMVAPPEAVRAQPFKPSFTIRFGAAETALALAATAEKLETVPWAIWRRDLRTAYEATLVANLQPGGVNLGEVIVQLSGALPDDAIIANGAGNYAAFLHRHFVCKNFPTQLAPRSGSMGYALPAAIAAKLAQGDRTVVAIAGDGCFQMTAQELATAVQFALPIIVIIANNNVLGTIRMHQHKRFPGRIVATSLVNPDFVDLARSYGATGIRISATEEFLPALKDALGARKPTVIEIEVAPDALTPGPVQRGRRNNAARM